MTGPFRPDRTTCPPTANAETSSDCRAKPNEEQVRRKHTLQATSGIPYQGNIDLFPQGTPATNRLDEFREGIRSYMKKRHARRSHQCSGAHNHSRRYKTATDA